MSDDQDQTTVAGARQRRASKLALRAERKHANVAARRRSDLPQGETSRVLLKRGAGQDVGQSSFLPPDTAVDRGELTARAWPTVRPLQVLLETRRERRRNFFKRLALFCGVPTLLVFLYFAFFASTRYISEAEFTYQTYQPPTSLSSGLVQTVMGGSQGSTVDMSTILYEYLRSEALMTKLDNELHLREYYSSPSVDYFSRMNRDASLATFLRYFRSNVSVSEGQGGYLTIDVYAYDPDYAVKLAKAVVRNTDQMIDDMTARARRDEVNFAEGQVKEAEDRLLKARLALTDFQNKHGDLNPQNSANQIGGIVGKIEGDLATQRTALESVNTLDRNSPQVAAIKSKIAALEGQLRNEQQRLASSAGGGTYSELLNKYAALQIEQDFAKDAYSAAQQGLLLARQDAARKENYLVDFAPPYKPDSAGFLLIMEYSAITLIISLVLFGIGSLVTGALRDQSGL
jgi:capsular polysaccharide transport system permease protein